jgi:hypothetical protein
MLKKIWNAWFPKPLTEEQKRWATILAVSCERVR